MAVSADLAQLLDREWEDETLTEVLAAPVSALAGVSAGDAEAPEAAFGVNTVGDLGRNESFRAAQSLALLGEAGAEEARSARVVAAGPPGSSGSRAGIGCAPEDPAGGLPAVVRGRPGTGARVGGPARGGSAGPG